METIILQTEQLAYIIGHLESKDDDFIKLKDARIIQAYSVPNIKVVEDKEGNKREVTDGARLQLNLVPVVYNELLVADGRNFALTLKTDKVLDLTDDFGDDIKELYNEIILKQNSNNG